MCNWFYNYEEYIRMGFKRYDYNDAIEYAESGYHPFLLTKKLGKDLSIEVQSITGKVMLYRGKKEETRLVCEIKDKDRFDFLLEIFGINLCASAVNERKEVSNG